MKAWLFIVPVVLTGCILGIVSSIFSPVLLVPVLFGIIYLYVCIADFQNGLILTMLARSSLDFFHPYTFDIPYLGAVNIASLLGVFVIILALLAFLSGRITLKSPLTPSFFIFLCVLTLGVIAGREFASGLHKWMKFASLFSFFIMIYYFSAADQKQSEKFLFAGVCSSLVPLGAGVIQLLTNSGNRMTEGLNRISGTLVHPNAYAYYLLIVLCMCFVLLGRGQSSKLKTVLIVFITFLSLFELIMTYSRGAWLGLLFTAVLVFVLIKQKGKAKYMVFFSIGVLPLLPAVVSRFSGIFSSRMEESSLATRFYIWSHMLRRSFDSPLLGHGLGTFEMYARQTVGWHIEAHNEYLRMFFETGVAGLTAYIGLVVFTLFCLKAGLRTRSVLSVSVFSLFIVFLVMGAFDNIIDNLVSQWYLWALVAAALAERRKEHESPVCQQVLLFEGRQ